MEQNRPYVSKDFAEFDQLMESSFPQGEPGAAVLVVGTNTGELWRVGAFTGRLLARYDLLYASAVLSVAVAETGEIAAGMANGQVAFLERVKDER
jgi:hypothetical protein